jgi:hypothetical protein
MTRLIESGLGLFDRLKAEKRFKAMAKEYREVVLNNRKISETLVQPESKNYESMTQIFGEISLTYEYKKRIPGFDKNGLFHRRTGYGIYLRFPLTGELIPVDNVKKALFYEEHMMAEIYVVKQFKPDLPVTEYPKWLTYLLQRQEKLKLGYSEEPRGSGRFISGT